MCASEQKRTGEDMSELYTLAECAAILKISTATVARKFSKLPGVVDVGTPETLHKLRYRVIRIPKAVLEKHLSKNAGHPVNVQTPTLPKVKKRRGKSRTWNVAAAQDLARAIANNTQDATERKTFEQ